MPPRIKIGMQGGNDPAKLENPPTIVAELSRNWPASELPPMARLFEDCIEFNRTRGYALSDWQFSQCAAGDQMVETVIAVFCQMPTPATVTARLKHHLTTKDRSP